jgi:Flp pilus assembly protein TadB
MNEQEKFLASVIWNHFQVHAGQRMTIFNFYVVFSSLLTGAILTSLQASTPHYFTLAVLGFGLIVLAYVFWRLDERNRLLIHCAEDALKCLEAESWTSHVRAESLRVFTKSEKETSGKKWHLKYSSCFRILFVVFAVFGLTVSIFAFLKVKVFLWAIV